MRAVLLVFTAGFLALNHAPEAQQRLPEPQPPEIVLVRPTAAEFVVGAVELEARVAANSPSVRRVEFFVDGLPACVAEQVPFVCRHQFGERVTPHLVRAIVTRTDGSYAATTVITAAALGEQTDVAAVLVSAVVTDNRNRFVKGLTKDDFRIVDNGELQSIMFLESEHVPTDIVLAVDASASMTESLPILKTAVKRFLTQIQSRGGHVRARVLGFNQAPFAVTQPDVPLAEQLRAVDALKAQGRSHVFDAILSGIRTFRAEVSRKAVIVLTDGDDNGSLAAIPAIRRRLAETDATLYVVTHGKAGEKEKARRAVAELAGISGGRPVQIGQVDELGAALDRIVEDLSNLYLMGYMPSHPPAMGEFRPYTVTTRAKGQQVRAREGYRMHRVEE